MRTEILRLESTIINGVGGIGAGAIGLIYTIFLQQYGLDFYSYIHINQVGEDLDEFVMKEGREVYINIHHQSTINVENETAMERALIRLEVVHRALLMLSESDKTFEKDILEDIRAEIVRSNFSFDFTLKEWAFGQNDILSVKLIVKPTETHFEFYALVLNGNTEKCKIHLYNGKCTDFYFEDIFCYGTWKSENELVISGQAKQVDMHLQIDKCKVEYVNLTVYERPPLFEMMRAGNAGADIYEDWLSSLPPEAKTIIGKVDN